MPRRREEVVLIGLAVAMGVVLLVALTMTRSGRDAPPPPDVTTLDDVCARCRDVTRAHSRIMSTPRDNAAGCSLEVYEDDEGGLSTACKYSTMPPQTYQDGMAMSDFVAPQDAERALALHRTHIKEYDVSLPRCANHADDPSQVTCCMTRMGEFETTCPLSCFHSNESPPIEQDGESRRKFGDITAKMRAGPAACFQSLDASTGLIQ